MKNKILGVILKVLFSLILLMPILGATGVFPAPARDLYNTDQAFAFLQALMAAGYVNVLMAIVSAVALIALWTKREALAAVLMAPVTANIVGFHLVLDGGLLTGGAVPADILLVLNAYVAWKYRAAYRALFASAGE